METKMSYDDIKKLAFDNFNKLMVDDSYKTKKGVFKKNLKKEQYIKLLKDAGIFIPNVIKTKEKTKKELYREAIKHGLNPEWLGSTKDSLRSIITNYVENLILSRQHEINDFFINQRPNAEINIRPETLINYLSYINYNRNLILRIGVEMDNSMSYRFISNNTNLNDILEKVRNGIDINDIEQPGSDADLLQHAIRYGSHLNLTWFPHEATFKKNSGRYMPYYNNTNLDLTRYQFYQTHQNKNSESCFLYALRMSGISDACISEIKLKLIQDNLNINDIKFIAEELGIRVNLTYYDEKYQFKRNKIFNKNGKIMVDIGLICNHYFINEQTNITNHAIKYYDELCNHSYFPSIYYHIKEYTRTPTIEKTNYKSPELSSFDVILSILKNNLVSPITLINCSKTNIEKLINYTQLVNPKESEIKPYDEFKKRFVFGKSNITDYDVIFADFETFICHKLNYHIPYCLCYSHIDSDEIKDIYDLNCAVDFLKTITKPSVIITHNLAFDFKMVQDYLTDIRECIQTGTQIKTITATYNGHKLVFKDNCAFLAKKLSELPKMFNLNAGDKEAYPYSLINHENYNSTRVPLSLCLKHLNSDKKDIFIKNAKDFISDNLVDIKAYTIKYCKQDVRILKEAFISFRKQILEISDNNIDIIHSISLSQVADDFFRLKGCFDGCYQFSGIAHDFIRRCIVGGRVMCRNNRKCHIKEILNDFDAVSLYPSAMKRLGYLLGLPNVINVFEPEHYDHYFIEIKINSIGINRAFPLCSIKTETGIHNFTNDLIGKNVYIDKTALEDLIEFQKIDYTFIRGYYFDDGFNYKIKEVIQDVFNKRVELKKAGNPLQQTYKLIMNSSYGKLCQKPIKRKIVFKENNQSANNFIVNNYERIIEYTHINDNLIKIVLEKSIINHFAPVHLACQVLTMSKRIMNEVMTLAEDNNINIYYQDTDSMHIDNSAINELSKLFYNKYNRELIGKKMGQFHSDFEVKNELAENIVACESIFLGKKCYIDKLQYTVNNEIFYDYHMRMKGVNSEAILDVGDPMETYMKLYNGISVAFNLAPYCVMQTTKNLRMIARSIFERILSF